MLSMTPLFFRRKPVVRAVGADRVAALISAGAVASIASVLLVMQLAQTRLFFLVSDLDHLHQL